MTVPYSGYQWIVSDPELLGGKLAVRGTRLSVAFVLSCLAENMSWEEIGETYVPIPEPARPEILRVAAELADAVHVAA